MSFHKNIRKVVSKKTSPTIAMDFSEEEVWTSLGNYAINKMMSGRYDRGLLFGRSMALGGASGSGKSLLAATAAAQAQKSVNAYVIWLDVEKATTGRSGQKWLGALGVDLSEENFLYVEVATIEDIKSIVSPIAAEMRKTNELRPVVVVIDSMGMVLTESQMEAATSGEVKNDQGQSAKQKKDLIISITHLSTRIPLATIPIVHTMASNDKYDPDEKLTSGRGIEYAASSVLVVNKRKLRGKAIEKSSKINITADEKDKVIGIKSKVQVYKSRFAKPNESVEVQIPYPDGLDPYSALFDLMKGIGEIKTMTAGWYSYTPKDGAMVKFYEKDFRDHADEIMRLSDADQLLIDDEVRAAGGLVEDAEQVEEAEQ